MVEMSFEYRKTQSNWLIITSRNVVFFLQMAATAFVIKCRFNQAIIVQVLIADSKVYDSGVGKEYLIISFLSK